MITFPRLSIACAALFSLVAPACAAAAPGTSSLIVLAASDHAGVHAQAALDRRPKDRNVEHDLVTLRTREPAQRNPKARQIFTKDEFRGYSSDFLTPDLIFSSMPSQLLRRNR